MFLSASCDRGLNSNNPKWNLVCLSTDTLTASLVLIQEETGPQRQDPTLKGVRRLTETSVDCTPSKLPCQLLCMPGQITGEDAFL